MGIGTSPTFVYWRPEFISPWWIWPPILNPPYLDQLLSKDEMARAAVRQIDRHLEILADVQKELKVTRNQIAKSYKLK